MALASFDVIVAATSSKFGIGAKGTLPWRLRTDMALFKRATSMPSPIPGKVNAVIMGRKTYESIPPKFRPLPGRLNVVLSRDPTAARAALGCGDEVPVLGSLEAALLHCYSGGDSKNIAQVFVIGGGELYKEAVARPDCARVLLTAVHSSAYDETLDTFFPALTHDAWTLKACSKVIEEGDTPFSFAVYEQIAPETAASSKEEGIAAAAASEPPLPEPPSADAASPPSPKQLTASAEAKLDDLLRGSADAEGATVAAAAEMCMVPRVPLASPAAAMVSGMAQHPEMQYLNLIRSIMETGVVRGDRTGTGTISKFGVQMRFSLRNGEFPLLTTKRVFWRGVAEELLWFVKGCTNGKELSDKGIKIWDGNGSKEFLTARGLGHREEGDLGPVYGFQWRHFGAAYVDMHADYSGQGVDQLAAVIASIKANPTDRRLLISAWNPADLAKMALPPCHMFCQFYVANGCLSCQMYQRSADMGLGVPFNIASYALLTCMVAQVCGLAPGEFVHTIGDAHVYLNHRSALKQQLARIPRPFPTLAIKPKANGEPITDIDGFDFSDFVIDGYNPHGTIKMEMAV